MIAGVIDDIGIGDGGKQGWAVLDVGEKVANSIEADS